MTDEEYWAYFDDISLVTTLELERHGMELRSGKWSAYCPKSEKT